MKFIAFIVVCFFKKNFLSFAEMAESLNKIAGKEKSHTKNSKIKANGFLCLQPTKETLWVVYFEITLTLADLHRRNYHQILSLKEAVNVTFLIKKSQQKTVTVLSLVSIIFTCFYKSF